MPVRPCRSRYSACTGRRLPATASPSSRTNSKAREISGIPSAACPREVGCPSGWPARLARADDDAAPELGAQGVPAHHQGRRAGFDRSHRGCARQAGYRRSSCEDRPFGRRRHHRKRRVAGGDVGFAAIIGFNVRANKQARDAASQSGSEIRYYRHHLRSWWTTSKPPCRACWSPERSRDLPWLRRNPGGVNITKVGKVAGCRVTEGKMERGAGVRLLRDNVVIHEGKLKTLKRFKDEVPRSPWGQECGHGLRELRKTSALPT